MQLLIFTYIIIVIGMLLFLSVLMIKMLFKKLNGEKIQIKDTYSFNWIPKSIFYYVIGASLLAVFIGKQNP